MVVLLFSLPIPAPDNGKLLTLSYNPTRCKMFQQEHLLGLLEQSLNLSRYSTSTSTSSPSTFTAKTPTFSPFGYSARPVLRSKAHECQGHTTALPSIQPCPNGPRRCGQMLSTAFNSPFNRARQISNSPARCSHTCPSAGASPAPHNRTHCAITPSLPPPSYKHLHALTSFVLAARMLP
jgi:hypothetical protein